LTVRIAFPSPEKVIGLGIVACGVGEALVGVIVGTAVKVRGVKVGVNEANSVAGKHEVKIIVNNANMPAALIFMLD
jgi:hypothetical protein